MKKLYIYISDETNAWEQQGYDVDVFDDEEEGRNDLSKVGLTLQDAEKYVNVLKENYDVEYVKYQ